MKIRIPYAYTAEVIPPRCRKPRPVQETSSIQLTIREVTGEQAPVAIRESYTDLSQDFVEGQPRPRAVKEYRWFARKLWVLNRFSRSVGAPDETQTAEQFAADPYPYATGKKADRIGLGWVARGMASKSKAECRAALMDWARGHLFIDGQRWRQASEPRYVVMTFGLGCNHGLGGGTSLSTADYYNPNVSKDRYFRIDQFEQAVEAATRIALGRGDTKAVPIIETQEPTRYEILIPEAVRLKPAREHGEGDSFINQVEDIICAARDPALAGFLVMGLCCATP